MNTASESSITAVVIDGRLFHNANDLRDKNSHYFSESKIMRDIVSIKSIPDRHYEFMTYTPRRNHTSGRKHNKSHIVYEPRAEWRVCSKTKPPKTARLFISKQFTDEHILSRPVYGIVILDAHECFRDVDGNPIPVLTRGSRVHDKLFIRMRDLVEYFNIPELIETLQSPDQDKYIPGRDVLFLNVPKNKEDDFISAPDDYLRNTHVPTTEDLYLTYKGYLQAIYRGTSPMCQMYQEAYTQMFREKRALVQASA